MEIGRSLAFGFLAIAWASSCLVACTEEDEMPAVRHPIGATTAPAPAQATERSNEASEASEEEAAAPDDQAESDQPVGGDPEDTDPSSLTEFHSTLDPYGTWTEDPTYGTVWTPSRDAVGSDFAVCLRGPLAL